MWLHRKECIFKGREASLDGALHEVEGLLAILAGGKRIDGGLVGTTHVIITIHTWQQVLGDLPKYFNIYIYITLVIEPLDNGPLYSGSVSMNLVY